MKFQIVDGSDNRPAPRPSRGMLLAVYTVLEAMGGPTDEDTVVKYLPASDVPATDYVDKGRIHQALMSGKTQGYFIYNRATKHWQIANRDYYEKRQAYLNDPDRPRRKIKASPKTGRDGDPNVQVIVREDVIARYLAVFAVGLAVASIWLQLV